MAHAILPVARANVMHRNHRRMFGAGDGWGLAVEVAHRGIGLDGFVGCARREVGSARRRPSAGRTSAHIYAHAAGRISVPAT